MTDTSKQTMNLIGAALLLFMASVGAQWKMVSVHAAAPHEGAISQKEMSLIRELVKTNDDVLLREIRSLKLEIKELRLSVRQFK